jgi:hypothetical protein
MPQYGGLGIFLDDPRTGSRVAETRADEEGRFRLRWIPPGQYVGTFWGGGCVPARRDVRVHPSVEDIGTVDLQAFERVPLRLRVRDGEPPVVVAVSASDVDRPGLPATVDLGGGHRWLLRPCVVGDDVGPSLRGLPAGTYRLVFRAEGFAAAEVVVRIDRRHERPVEVALERP